jgi:drug/metabolite transporter (DMT)-like permease
MPITLVFLSVVAIWSTTPLAIVWSTLGSSHSFGVAARMVLGLSICLLLLLIKKQKLTLTPLSLWNYWYAGLGVFVTMSLIYYASQNLASGVISIIFGLTPIVTGVFALILLRDKFFGFNKMIGLLLGLSGLIVIFSHSLVESTDLVRGLLAVTLGMAFQAFISVKLKQINAQISVLETTTGALLFSTPLFVIMWLFSEGSVPEITLKGVLSIGYLSTFGSVAGFMSYYYLIKHASVRVVGIVPLITPVFALLLGSLFNNETLSLMQVGGIVLVLTGLGYYEYGAKASK